MAMAMLATAPMFLVNAGTVMTDSVHVIAVTAAMLLSGRALRHPDQRRWRLMFWAVLGAATLAKGLATLVLIGLPIVSYGILGEGVVVVTRRLWDPWGLILAAAICLGWYVPAEMAYPGFLEYFLIGEHFKRFLQSGWTGDRYGHAHQTAFGMIWFFWLVGIGQWLPVFLLGIRQIFQRDSKIRSTMSDRWLWCWVLAPLIFFSFSRNIIVTYTLTAIPPFAVVVGQWAESREGWIRRSTPKWVFGFALCLCVVGLTWLPGAVENQSARQLLRQAELLNPDASVVVKDCFPFSSRFYTRGKARQTDDLEVIKDASMQPGTVLIVSESDAKLLQGTVRMPSKTQGSRGVLFTVPSPKL